jgi:5-methylcytosine-specific restriction protein A
MPRKPGRQCPGRGPHTRICKNIAKGNDRYCPTCSEYADAEMQQRNKVYDQERDQTTCRRFLHSTHWRKIRLRKLAQDPLCESCATSGALSRATIVHHIDGDELNNYSSNHRSVCNSCHEKIHKKDRWRKDD